MGDVYGDGPKWIERSGWTLGSEVKRWVKCWLSRVPGRAGSALRRRLYGFGSCGTDVLLCEGLWVEYPRSLDIGDHVGINRNCSINAGGGVMISDWCLIGPSVTIYSQNHDLSRIDVPLALAGDIRAPVCVGKGVWLAANCTILAGVTIGEGAVVAAGAVVTKDVPPYTVVGGVPAHVISALPYETVEEQCS